MAQVMVCTETGKMIDRIEYVFVENGKVSRGRPAHKAEVYRNRLGEFRKDAKGRYNAAKNKGTYVAQVKVYEDGTREMSRVKDPR